MEPQPRGLVNWRKGGAMDDLTDEELAQAQRLIDAADPGRCTLSEIYDKKWRSVPKPQSFGIRFMASVENGSLKGIRYVDRRANNHHEYEILGKPMA